jgi:hypothetical protein
VFGQKISVKELHLVDEKNGKCKDQRKEEWYLQALFIRRNEKEKPVVLLL